MPDLAGQTIAQYQIVDIAEVNVSIHRLVPKSQTTRASRNPGGPIPLEK